MRTQLIAAAFMSLMIGCSGGGKQVDNLSLLKMLPAEAAGCKLSEDGSSYDRQTIFDYINGAGEVYRSYGFRQLNVGTYSGATDSLIVEIFDMGAPEEAFGIFSHAREDEKTGIGGGYELSRGLLCFYQSSYFVCIRSDSRAADSTNMLVEVGEAISASLPRNSAQPKLVDYLPDEDQSSYSLKYFHQHPSLNYHYYLSEENLLNLSEETDAVLARYSPGAVFMVCIAYPDDEAALAAHDKFAAGYAPELSDGYAETSPGKWLGLNQSGRFIVLALDVPTMERAMQMVTSCVALLPSS